MGTPRPALNDASPRTPFGSAHDGFLVTVLSDGAVSMPAGLLVVDGSFASRSMSHFRSIAQ